MVIFQLPGTEIASALLAEVLTTKPLLERLDPPRRAAVVMALLALVLTGLLLVTCAMLGANWVRRMARQKPGPRLPRTSAAALAENKRLRESLESMLPEVETKDTIHGGRASGDTTVGP